MPPIWVFGLASLGACLAMGVLYHHTTDTIAAQVITVASSLITGAFGVATGHAIGTASRTKVDTGNAPVTINQVDSNPKQ